MKRKRIMRRKKGRVLITAGCLLLLSAGLLTAYNLYDEQRATQQAQEAFDQLEMLVLPQRQQFAPVGQQFAPIEVELQLPEFAQQPVQVVTAALPEVERVEADEIVVIPEVEIPDYVLNPKMEMPVVRYENEEYIGLLEIPALGLKLPIMSEWSYSRLKKSPCRYTGSAYLDNLVLSAHNYESHFGRLKELDEGERIVFTDTDGNRFNYEVVFIETLKPTAIRAMTSSEYDLTLFTCTVGGKSRVTVRCDRVEDGWTW